MLPKITIITVCKDYSDYLQHTLPRNLNQANSFIVVTHPDDLKTREICAQYAPLVTVVLTDCFYENGAAFNKGRAVNEGIDQITSPTWLLHLDSDIVLCADFKSQLADVDLEEDKIYGVDRCRIRGFNVWMEWQNKIDERATISLPYESSGYRHRPIDKFPLDDRFIHHKYGYTPMGYFQLWHSSIKHRYPTSVGSADYSDTLFAAQWPRSRRILIPDTVAYHLESEASALGVNWKGRKSPPFKEIPC